MATATPKSPRLPAIICLVLAAATLAVYWPVTRHGFINFDDPPYITENPNVQSGLTWHGLAWAFQIGYAAYWQPLTWISHMLDCQLFGLHAAGHHLVNILFHAANAMLLFLLLNRLTGATWRSAFVAAFFVWHPLRVESVAWAAERKDVLSGFFWMLTLLAYTGYARRVKRDECQLTGTVSIASPVTRRPSCFYILALFFFACGLMSKPMVVTLPFVLLLLDYWPLKRFNDLTIQRLLLEKLPFFALSATASIVMSIAQKTNMSIWSLTELPLRLRLENAAVSYLRYVSKMFWPTDLAVIYPYPHQWPAALVMTAVAFLVGWTALALWRIRQNPYLAVGWFWFLGTLVPVIGFVQTGMQSMADRFTYLPGIGLLIAVVWSAYDLFQKTDQKKYLAIAGAVALAGCLMATSIQINYWQNDLKLFAHTVEVTTDNYAAEVCLGEALERDGHGDNALPFYSDAVRIEPDYPPGQFKLGMILLEQGRADEASSHLALAAQLAPRDPVIQFDFGTFLLQHGQPDEAANYFMATLAANPDFAEAKTNLAAALAGQRGK
jgi:tetratricopeptide (TPR) repeat protein